MRAQLPNTPGRHCCVAVLAIVVACGGATAISSAGEPSDTTVPVSLPTELTSTAVLARAPLRDTARVAGVAGGAAVVGLLNQTPPCFALSSAATRTGSRVVVRMTAKETTGTCATFAAGAFDYDLGVTGLAPGTYEVEVVHRVERKDGSVVEQKAGGTRVAVR